MGIDRTPPFGRDRCDICAQPLDPADQRKEPHVHPECAEGGRPWARQLALA